MADDRYVLVLDAEDDASEAIDDVDAEVEKLDDSMDSASSTADTYSAALAGGIAGGVADQAIEKAGELAGAVVDSTQRFIESTSAIEENAQAAGVSTQKYQQLRFAFEQVGLQGDQLTEALNTIAERSFDARDGAQGMVDDFSSIGIEVEQLRGKSPGELFELVTERIGEAESQTQAAKGATSLLGDELATKLLPRLRQNADAFDDLSERAARTGNVMSEHTIEQARMARAEFRELGAIFDGLVKQGQSAMLPYLNDLTQRMQRLVTIGREGGTGAAIGAAASGAVANVGKLSVELVNQTGIGSAIFGEVESSKRAARAKQMIDEAVGADFDPSEDAGAVTAALAAGEEKPARFQSGAFEGTTGGGSAVGPAQIRGGGGGGQQRDRQRERHQKRLENIEQQHERRMREIKEAATERERRIERRADRREQALDRAESIGPQAPPGGAGLSSEVQRRARGGRGLVGADRRDVMARRAGRGVAAAGRGAAGGARAARGAAGLVQMQERGAEAAAIHNRRVSQQVRLYGQLGGKMGRLTAGLGKLAEKQFEFGEATKATESAVSALSQVGGVASKFIEGTKKRAGVRAGFEAAAAAAATGAALASAGAAPNLWAAAAQHGIAAATYGAVATGMISAGGGGSGRRSGGGGGGGGSVSPGGSVQQIDPERQRQRTAEAFADALETRSRDRAVTVDLSFGGDVVAPAGSGSLRRMVTRAMDTAEREIGVSIGRGRGQG